MIQCMPFFEKIGINVFGVSFWNWTGHFARSPLALRG
jgi:hypothetical protein